MGYPMAELGIHLPYGIILCYLPHDTDTGEYALP